MRRMVPALAFALAATWLAASCRGSHRATDADCALLLDRLVELESREHGFQDPALLERRRSAARAKLGAELASCRGRRMPSTAPDCVARASTSEEVALCLK